MTVSACCGISDFVVCRITRTSRLLWCCLDNGCACLECACCCLLFDGAVAVVVRVAVFPTGGILSHVEGGYYWMLVSGVD